MKLQLIQLSQAYESTTNPRGKETKGPSFDELVASVKTKGVLVPVLARPLKKAGKEYEIVAGNRRFLAAQAAGLKEIPAKVQEMTDTEAQEAQIVENLQREDVHPLEEGESYLKLIKTNNDIKAVGAKVGKSEAYVRNRIMLCNLSDEAKSAYRQGTINDGHAQEISRLSPFGDQQKTLTHIKNTSWGGSRNISVKDLKEWIEETFFDELAFQPWLKNKEAMAAVGPCKGCPAETNTLFGEVKEGACTTTCCHHRKLKKYIEWMKEQTPGLVLVSTEYSHPAGVLGEYDYKKAAKDAKGAKSALIVTGKNRGKLINVIVTKLPVNQMTPEEKAKHEEDVKREREATEKRKAAELERESRKMEGMLKNITWPLKEKHLEPLFDIALDHASDLEDIATRRKLEGKRDEDGNYADPEKVLRDFFTKADARTKMQLIVEVSLSEVWNNDRIVKKFS